MAMLLAAGQVAAQDEDEVSEDVFIMGAWVDPADCNQQNAQLVSFSTLASDFQTMLGACVAVDGYWSGRALFSSAKAANSDRSNVSRRLRQQRVGLYAQWDAIGEPPDNPTRTTFAGRVGECESQWPGAMMVMGYCHYTGGPILLVSQAIAR